MAVAYLGLGSNLGNRLAFLRGARQALSGHPDIELERSSAVYETAAQGGPPDSPDFLNAVLAIRTGLDPRRLLDFCMGIEKEYGRVRSEHWGPRTLDIDLLLYDDQVLAEEGLQLPHPRLQERAFVLVPLAEIAPDVVHPQKRFSIADLAGQCPETGMVTRLRSTW